MPGPAPSRSVEAKADVDGSSAWIHGHARSFSAGTRSERSYLLAHTSASSRGQPRAARSPRASCASSYECWRGNAASVGASRRISSGTATPWSSYAKASQYTSSNDSLDTRTSL